MSNDDRAAVARSESIDAIRFHSVFGENSGVAGTEVTDRPPFPAGDCSPQRAVADDR